MKFVAMQGVNVPALGLGTWQLEGEDCVRGVKAAIGVGYRHIDTAQIYGNESEVGRGVAESGVGRGELFITTKLWTNNFTEERAAKSLEESLRKLRTEYVDLLLIHWPNPQVRLEETLRAMEKMAAAGKVRLIGVSNFPVAWMKEAVEACGAKVACNQVEYHALLSQEKVISYARGHGIAVTAYSPLARGRLLTHPLLVSIGEKYGKSAGQVALRWLIEQDGVLAIPKATGERHIRGNFELFDFSLDTEEMARIGALGKERVRTVDPDFAPEWD